LRAFEVRGYWRGVLSCLAPEQINIDANVSDGAIAKAIRAAHNLASKPVEITQ
jgi:hypothetical protein